MTAPAIRCGQRYTETYSGATYVLDAVDATGTHYLAGAKGREVRVTEAELRREFALVDDALDFSAETMARRSTRAQACRRTA